MCIRDRGFNFRGGWVIIPEMASLLLALTIYTAAFIAEIVRAGIQAVSHGQTEASFSLGINSGKTLRPVSYTHLDVYKRQVLAPNGTYVQFTYGPKPPLSPEQLDRMGLTVTPGPKVWANLPPARVFHFRRAA